MLTTVIAGNSSAVTVMNRMRLGIIRYMRFPVVLSFLPLMSLGVTVEPLPISEFMDTEVSTNISFEVSFDEMSWMNFSISLEASQSNCIEVSIGEDANADGVLSLDEADQTFGYNCGTWFQRDAIGDEEYRRTGVPPVQCWPAQNGQDARSPDAQRLSRTFVLKKRKLDESWNLVKVTRRGVADVGEVVLVEGAKPGAALIVR